MKLNRRISGRIERPADKRRYVRRLFAGVAGRYDLTNDVMSLGLHRRWKRRLLELTDLRPGHRVLDLAAGTGDLARGALDRAARKGFEIRVVAADLTPEMMRAGRTRGSGALQGWIGADALRLPFPDGAFDRVLVGYGLRNFADLDAGLAESFRCLRPGGRLVSLDFGHPRSTALRRAYFAYLNVSTRVVGWALHRDPESYVYIPESLRRFPDQRAMVRRMEAAGFERCRYEELMLGTMAINYGDRR
ncbi:ubiquinone/menaquinone biosynthesis methyltransferase [Candidatus Palauibacter sp.]|uniref:ubiquinone/menaquinone biosynthesis methyltransferase n=1 Tax=Candidatus Palauibacter sp. TaxID=3101350 RepID=UPI003B5281D3